MEVAVIGAGPAGLAAAYSLTKEGARVRVFEAGSAPGGMARTLRLWNQRVDLGPHRFYSKDARVNALWLEIVAGDYVVVDRLTRVLYEGRFHAYPLGLDALRTIGWKASLQCLLSYAREKVRPTPQDGSFDAWIAGRFGRRAADIFFTPYSRKLWGTSCREIEADFAAQRIRTLDVREMLMSAFAPGRRGASRTLASRFAYPRLGTGMVYERMAAAVAAGAGRVVYNAPVLGFVPESGGRLSLCLPDGLREGPFDHVVSTMPLSVLIERLPDAPETVRRAASGLRFRNTIIVYLRLESSDVFPDQWIYVQSPSFGVGRITNFRNWSPDLYAAETSTILALEYWCDDEDPVWTSPPEALIRRAEDDLSRIFPGQRTLDGHVERLPRCYPVYRKGYKDLLRPIREYAATIEGLSVIGRYGSFKYNNQDHSLLMGLLAAENISRGRRHDLWEVNGDFDDYHERAELPDR